MTNRVSILQDIRTSHAQYTQAKWDMVEKKNKLKTWPVFSVLKVAAHAWDPPLTHSHTHCERKRERGGVGSRIEKRE